MYGTIARMKVNPGKMDEMLAWGRENDNRDEDGGVLLVYQSDDDPNELYIVVAAPSREVYRKRAESPEQHEQFLEMMEYLVAEPEWHDGEILYSNM